MQNSIMGRQAHFARCLGLALFACLLVGCNAMRFGYSNAESIVYWWLNGYVEFDGAQEPWVRRRIDDFFAWHRRTQLNDYAQLLEQGRRQLQNEVTPGQVLADYDAISKRMQIAIDRALPDLADLALSLDAGQIAHIEKKFAANDESYRSDYLSGDLEHRQQHRYKRVLKQAEYWFGDLTPEQKAQIRAASDARPLDNELWMAERMRRQRELIALLRRIQEEKPGREAATRMLRNHVEAALDHFGDAKSKAYFEASRQAAAKMVALIINIATPEQKAHAARRMQKWIDDFHAIASGAN